ncbi:uncharacterized protein CHSO_2003 [Chryseobacterium sp. StRB126]|uniref:hypothetical protein n=1 Tax=Chryseobacterium sp. StRB126 TaxID=878220 RepID=UPI0004E983D2|nr:hypothetical protein [Chryseobacterium sp. StRB126]BAP31040.1 uncharacterized protein CHSO_2003 [Chryseobacterium sp. StRB126]
MIKFLNKIDDVRSFVISDKKLYWISNDRLYYELTKDEITSIEFPSSVIYLVEDLIFSGKNFYYDPRNNVVTIIGELEGYYYSSISNNKLTLFSGNDLLLYNIQMKEIQWKQNYFDNSSVTFIKNNHFVNYSEHQIDCYDFFNNTTIWKLRNLDFFNSADSFFSQEILLYKDKLFINALSNDIFNNCIVDISTGNVVKEYRGLYGQMILEGDNLYFLSPDHISILNTENQEVATYTITDIFESTEIKRLLFPRWFIKNGIIYFTQSGEVDMHSGSRGAIFGALDAVSLKILWYERLSKEHCIIGTIQVENEKIYLHTQDKILFVFEKEN